MGSLKKYVTCIIALFNPFSYLSHFVNFSCGIHQTTIRNYKMSEKKASAQQHMLKEVKIPSPEAI